MATINSITMGKARGKLGNVILQSYKGKTFARQKNETISTEPSELQLDQRARMFNCSRAIEFIYPYVDGFKNKKMKGLNFPNWLTKEASQLFTSTRAKKGYISIRQLAENSFGDGYIVQLNQITLIDNPAGLKKVRVYFSTMIEQLEDNIIMYVVTSYVNNIGGDMFEVRTVTAQQELTAQNWVDGYVEIEVNNEGMQFVIAYANQYYTYSSNLLFSEIFD